MTQYKPLSENTDSTLVSEYTPVANKSDSYQSEAELEQEFIKMLTEQGYQYLQIHKEKDLIDNLRTQIERLNKYTFSDNEWKTFWDKHIANKNDGIVEKTKTIQEDHIKSMTMDDGLTKNIMLLDKENIFNNSLQVINQYENTGKYDNRYDVTILVNGLPLVHIELKKRGVALKEAFNQIDRYQRDSFWANSGLYEYVQIFVISNGTTTKYYSNTTRFSAINGKNKKTSNSFEFTSYWADEKNKVIPDLVDFTLTFFYKPTLLNLIFKYCVFTSEQMLLAMRPYQIAACEKILNRLKIADNYKYYGSIKGGGYIWHTTGSGKTLTSFKTAQIASKLSYIDKVLFVVDRKDLDYQTMKEYDRFEKGAANSNKSTTILKRQLEDSNCKIIITTIQKLAIFCKKNAGHEVFSKRVCMIFDECHRSQFGKFHSDIVKSFKKYNLFGFTGTPIFAENMGAVIDPRYATTKQVFGDCLHSYTIIDAIKDGNVLKFKVDIVKTIAEKDDISEKEVNDIARNKALLDPRRISNVVSYIREHFAQKTMRGNAYTHSVITNVQETAKDQKKEKKNPKKVDGFNSLFAVQSIDFAKAYYTEFKKQQKDLPDDQKLKVATIFSYAANEEVGDDAFMDDENNEDTELLDASSRDFLESAINDYNIMFHTAYDTSSDKFQNYYKDVSMRMKNNEIDILIVVNMFLTGFDATTLNTLWVDKNLKYHGLIQAFSRTNRILNTIKSFGNIVCFRNLEKRVNEAVAMFGGAEGGVVLLRSFDDYYNGWDEDENHYPGYTEILEKLLTKFPLDKFLDTCIDKKEKKEFVSIFGALLRAMNILSTFDEFEGKEILSERDFQNYKSHYCDIYEELKPEKHENEIINDDIVFEVELIKRFEVDIAYILKLVEEYAKSGKTDKEIINRIKSAIGGSPTLRSKIRLIEDFINNLQGDDVNGEWPTYIEKQITEDLERIINEENLKYDETYSFVNSVLTSKTFTTSGSAISNILPQMSRFGTNRTTIKERVIEKLKNFFDMYWDLNINPVKH